MVLRVVRAFEDDVIIAGLTLGRLAQISEGKTPPNEGPARTATAGVIAGGSVSSAI